MTNEQKMEGIMKELEKGVSFFFNSDHFKDYLDVMSRFHTYSLNNQILIAMQRPDASYVAGYKSWKNNFERIVRKGEKGIIIIAPSQKTFYTEERNPDTGEIENKEHKYITFRPCYVFDISQTEGKELPSPVKILEGEVVNYNQIMKALAFSSPYSVNIMEMSGNANGYCSYTDEVIHIKAGMSELQTIKTTVHEIAHARVHSSSSDKDRAQKEIEAESIAYCVCSYLGLDTSDYSFGYVAAWAGNRQVSVLKDCLETIRMESKDIIDIVDKYMDERSHMLGEVSVPEIEARAVEALDESIAEYGYKSKVISSRYYGCNRDGEYVRAKVLVQYTGTDREDTLFNDVNREAVKIDGVTIDINPINENKSGDIDSYYRQVKVWEKEDMTDDSWPMVKVIQSSLPELPVGKINILEAERLVSQAEKKISEEGSTSVVRIELEYTYAGEKKKISDRIFLGEGRISLVNTINISIPEKQYLKRHIQLLETINLSRENPISPGTKYQARYEDMMLEWAEKQRIELNYNVEPEITRPPELKPGLVRQHEEWEMIR